jgi:hypothetical protein
MNLYSLKFPVEFEVASTFHGNPQKIATSEKLPPSGSAS